MDYNTFNVKTALSLHYKITDSVETVVSSNYSTGSTVYQGDNRYRLDGVQFFQHKLEFKQEGKSETWIAWQDQFIEDNLELLPGLP
ncbi:MAG: hypothetical protein IPI07_16340 [Flavobacteriales bacterium]|nr:hypothetical protein [Flavobacteriales bacterium]